MQFAVWAEEVPLARFLSSFQVIFFLICKLDEGGYQAVCYFPQQANLLVYFERRFQFACYLSEPKKHWAELPRFISGFDKSPEVYLQPVGNSKADFCHFSDKQAWTKASFSKLKQMLIVAAHTV